MLKLFPQRPACPGKILHLPVSLDLSLGKVLNVFTRALGLAFPFILPSEQIEVSIYFESMKFLQYFLTVG